MSEETIGVLDAVGPRLRALRQQRQITLTALSAATGISVSTLSRLESGHRRPSLELLLPLARTYRVPLDELVGAPATGDPRVHLKPKTLHGMTVVPLSEQPGPLQAFKLILPARPPTQQPRAQSHQQPHPQSHQGHEWVYVLSGRLRLVLGEHDLVLGQGEAAEFDTRVPHWMGNAGTRTVEFLALYGKQGERAHLRTGTPSAAGKPPPAR